jgi:hypothetical protein
MNRLLREAAIAWDLRNPDNRCDPATSDWPFVCQVVLAYLRHSLTDYDRLVDPENREALRSQVQIAAYRQYPWLRPKTDPRKGAVNCENSGKHFKVLNEASAQLAELVSTRAHLIEARRHEKDKARRELIAKDLKRTEEVIKQRRSLFETFPGPDGKPGSQFIVWDQSTPGYSFGCRSLAPNYLEEAGFKCPKCGKAVMRTKRPLDLGAGIKLVCLSCECMSIAVAREYARANAKAWRDLLEGD